MQNIQFSWKNLTISENTSLIARCSLLHACNLEIIIRTVNYLYVDLAYLEKTLISKWKSGPCFNIET